MKKIILYYVDSIFRVHLSTDNTSIIDSYRIKRYSEMKKFLNCIKKDETDEYAINKRSLSSMIREWRVHNLLYSLGYKRERTGTVDLDINQPWYMKLAYTVLSPFYLHFS